MGPSFLSVYLRVNLCRLVADSIWVDGGFFVFGDLSVKLEGDFRLRFSLYEMLK